MLEYIFKKKKKMEKNNERIEEADFWINEFKVYKQGNKNLVLLPEDLGFLIEILEGLTKDKLLKK